MKNKLILIASLLLINVNIFSAVRPVSMHNVKNKNTFYLEIIQYLLMYYTTKELNKIVKKEKEEIVEFVIDKIGIKK